MTVTDNSGALAPAGPRDNGGLLMMLEQIADEGWDGPTGRRLLTFVRERLARPLAVGAGLRGLAASQAEASAWQAAWEVLAFQNLHEAEKPWGVVWRAAQRAVSGEVVCARYGADPWQSLRLARNGAPQLVGLVVHGQPVLTPSVSDIVPGQSASITDCVDSTNWQPIYAATGKSAAAPGQAARLV